MINLCLFQLQALSSNFKIMDSSHMNPWMEFWYNVHTLYETMKRRILGKILVTGCNHPDVWPCKWQNVFNFSDVIRNTIWWLARQPKEHDDHSHRQNTALKTQISPPHRSWFGEQAALRRLLGSSCRDRKGCRSQSLLPGRLLLCHVHHSASCLRAKVQGSELNIQPRYICWAGHLHGGRRDLKTQRVKKKIFLNYKPSRYISSGLWFYEPSTGRILISVKRDLYQCK